jgi:hypothetical protein
MASILNDFAARIDVLTAASIKSFPFSAPMHFFHCILRSSFIGRVEKKNQAYWQFKFSPGKVAVQVLMLCDKGQ